MVTGLPRSSLLRHVARPSVWADSVRGPGTHAGSKAVECPQRPRGSGLTARRLGARVLGGDGASPPALWPWRSPSGPRFPGGRRGWTGRMRSRADAQRRGDAPGTRRSSARGRGSESPGGFRAAAVTVTTGAAVGPGASGEVEDEQQEMSAWGPVSHVGGQARSLGSGFSLTEARGGCCGRGPLDLGLRKASARASPAPESLRGAVGGPGPAGQRAAGSAGPAREPLPACALRPAAFGESRRKAERVTPRTPACASRHEGPFQRRLSRGRSFVTQALPPSGTAGCPSARSLL